jgi:hypothetical protein
MRRYVGTLAALAVVLSSAAGCATRVPIGVVVPPALQPRQPELVLLVVDDELRAASFRTRRGTKAWVYPLGETLPAIVERTLSESFQLVTVARDESAVAGFDLVVRPRLARFEAAIPSSPFAPTPTTLEIAYRVRDLRSGKTHQLSVVGTQEVVTERDDELHRRLPAAGWRRARADSRDTSVAVTMAPEHEQVAARDATMAILHCIDELNQQLRSVVLGR